MTAEQDSEANSKQEKVQIDREDKNIKGTVVISGKLCAKGYTVLLVSFC